MDKLTLADQQKVYKMSDERLREKLVDAAHGRTDIELTKRNFWTPSLIFSPKPIPMFPFRSRRPLDGRIGGNPELDREIFEFDKRKWDAEERYRELEMKKWESEQEERRAERKERDRKWEAKERRKQAEIEERNRKWEAEREDRKAETKLKEAEFE